VVREEPQYAHVHGEPGWPFDQWPIGMGFEYFYGFVGGDTSQWEPNLFRNATAIYPYVGHPGWNLTTAMADDAIDWMNQLNEIDPSKPFFCYYVPGGTHAPHHPTPGWIKKISDMHLFDKGWNDLREQIFANQKKLGVIPQDAKMTPWPDNLLKKWDALTPDEKKMFIRQVEVYDRRLPAGSDLLRSFRFAVKLATSLVQISRITSTHSRRIFQRCFYDVP
jgi:arylsulfatase A-like enzyme